MGIHGRLGAARGRLGNMSTVTSTSSRTASDVLIRVVRSVSVTVPATRRARAAALADARRIYGFDVSDDDRAERIRNRRRR